MAFRYKLTLEYDGTHYAGWQRQTDRLSVQEALVTAAEKFSGAEVEVVGAGRTDAGVHAIGQVAHIDLPKEADPYRVMQGINFYLFNPQGNEPPPESYHNRISVLQAEAVSSEFHARFSAIRRHYLYRIINRRSRLGLEAGRAWGVVEPLDEKLMQQAANLLVGTQDFSSFRDTQCQAKSPVKTLEELTVKRIGQEIHIIANARSFLHHQVRIMTGTLVQVGKGRWSVDDVARALAAKDRIAGGPTAPSEGLYLTRVDY
ncbi:MAG: tRNA pseudouridine(38-40) synthase TruA [Rickettsiales bacterium]|nr:tRNA pseudouridine(38-40) synthase TruA [Rickettsiales bacterium]